jgi:hypothetical protein
VASLGVSFGVRIRDRKDALQRCGGASESTHVIWKELTLEIGLSQTPLDPDSCISPNSPSRCTYVI